MSRALSQMIFLQWKASRWLLLPFMLLCFGLPQLAVRTAERSARLDDATVAVDWLLGVLALWMPLFPLLAAAVGIAVGLSAWNWDHRVNHVYSLSLPLRRRDYALLKLLAGAAALLLPLAAVLLGALIAIAAVDLPPGLRGYPVTFSLHFLLAMLLAYALAFALAAGTLRTTVIVFVSLIVFVVFGTIAAEYINDVTRLDIVTPLEILEELFVHWAGPFHVFGGRWTLIDV